MANRDDASRDLLFGLLALQNGMVTRDQLVAAFGVWTAAGGKPMGTLLVEQGALTQSRRGLLDALTADHLANHGGDPEESLAALDISSTIRGSLAGIDDPDIGRTLTRVGYGSTDLEFDVERTSTSGDGPAAGDGQRFRVLRPHAKGGLGAVFVAMDTELHREVALKQILDSHADDPVSRQRFLMEAEVTGGLEHPGIVPVYALGAYDCGRPYYAMRFIKGESLKKAIERFHVHSLSKNDPGGRSLEMRELLHRFIDVCNAIEYAHSRGILHRDIKPSNVILGKHGETLVVDWGLAKSLNKHEPNAETTERPLIPSAGSGSAETVHGSALGTPAYMSPEQAAGRLEHLGPRSDVYSLGATLYTLLTGRPPFDGEIADVLEAVQRGDVVRPSRREPGLDPALEAVCLKAMARTPADRYTTSRALADDLKRWTADEPVSAWREPLVRRARRWAKRNRTVVSTAVVTLVAGLLGLTAVAGIQARVSAQLSKAYDATIRALADTRTAQAQTKAALEQSQRNLYFASIGLAEREWAGHHIAGTEQFLAQCPPRLRRWEWHHFDALCRTGEGSLDAQDGEVHGLAFSPDSRTLATAGSDRVVSLWDMSQRRRRLRLTGHSATVAALAFSPDGRRLASGSLDGIVRLWDTADGRMLRELTGHHGEVLTVAFHPTRPELAAATGMTYQPTEAGDIQVWNVDTGAALRRLTGHKGSINCVAYSPDGQLLASAAEDQTIVFWSDRDGKPVRSLSLSPASTPARTANRVLRFRDAKTGQERPLLLNVSSAQRISFSGDGTRLAAAVADGTVRLWETSTGKELLSLPAHEGAAHAIAISPDGKEIASGGVDRVVELWNTATGTELHSYLGHRTMISELAYSPDGRWLASGDVDGLIKLWDPTQRQDTHLFRGLNAAAFGVAFSPDGKTLAAGTGDLFQPRKAGEITLWDVASRAELRTLRGHKGGISCVAFSPRGDRIASASADATVRIWDVASGREVRTLSGHKGVVFRVVWSPDGRLIASGSGALLVPGLPGELKLWDAETGAEKYTVRDHQASVGSLVFSPDGRWLASGSPDKTVKVRDAATGQVVRTLAGLEPGVFVLAYSPDGTRLAIGCGAALQPSQPSDVTIWNTKSWTLVHTLRAHAQQVSGVTYSPDGSRLVTASRDGTVRVWDVDAGQQVCALKPSSLYVNSIAFSPDGQRIATGNWNATVNMWEAPGAAAGRP